MDAALRSPPPRARPIIVVIDDDPDLRETLALQLKALRAEVTVAADGLEGFKQLRRRAPHAVLCDLTMPVMDGFEFAARMRRDPRYRKILLVAITGRASLADLVETCRAGFDGHLVKPVTAAMLAGVMGRLTGSGFDSAPNA